MAEATTLLPLLDFCPEAAHNPSGNGSPHGLDVEGTSRTFANLLRFSTGEENAREE